MPPRGRHLKLSGYAESVHPYHQRQLSLRWAIYCAPVDSTLLGTCCQESRNITPKCHRRSSAPAFRSRVLLPVSTAPQTNAIFRLLDQCCFEFRPAMTAVVGHGVISSTWSTGRLVCRQGTSPPESKAPRVLTDLAVVTSGTPRVRSWLVSSRVKHSVWNSTPQVYSFRRE